MKESEHLSHLSATASTSMPVGVIEYTIESDVWGVWTCETTLTASSQEVHLPTLPPPQKILHKSSTKNESVMNKMMWCLQDQMVILSQSLSQKWEPKM